MTSTPITVTGHADVERAIVQVLNDAIFGVGQFPNPAVLTSVNLNGTVVPIRIYRGWPSDDRLQADMRAGGVNVSVYPLPILRNTTRFQLTPETYGTAALTANVSVQGNAVTVSGVGSSANLVAVAQGSLSASYRPQDGDTPQTIATALSAGIPGSSVSVATVTLPGGAPVIARVVGDVTRLLEAGRQSQRFDVSVWASSDEFRDLVGLVVQGAMARTVSLSLPYNIGTQPPQLRLMPSPQMDQKVGVFKQSLHYEIEYPTVDMTVVPAVALICPSLNGQQLDVE